MIRPLVAGPELRLAGLVSRGSSRMRGITLPFPWTSGVTGGNWLVEWSSARSAAAAAASCAAVMLPAPGLISVIWNVRDLVNCAGTMSNGNLLGLKMRSGAALDSSVLASSIGTCTPSTATTGQLSRIPEDFTDQPLPGLLITLAWIAAFERTWLTSVPAGTTTVQTSHIEV